MSQLDENIYREPSLNKNKSRMNDLEKMSVMAKEDMDIRMCSNVIAADKVKQGGKITLGVDADTFNKIITQMATGEVTHYVALYVINKEQFDKL